VPIWVYQRVFSPALPASCIYTPSCSEYTRRAILRHGIAGVLLGVLRVLRCAGGLFTGGDDPVPERITARYMFGSFRTFRRRRGG
jgi:putative membrane protein insertion efficiency factor